MFPFVTDQSKEIKSLISQGSIDQALKHVEEDISVLLDEKRVFNPTEDFINKTNVKQWMDRHNISNLDEIYKKGEKWEEFWDEISKHYDFIVEKRRDYLNWRYCDPRCGDFIVKIAEYKKEIVGYSVLRINRYLREYPIGYIVDLLTLPNRLDVSEALAADAISYFDSNGVNIINYQVVKNHPHEQILKKQGFLNSRIKIHLFYNPLGNVDEISKLRNSPQNRIYVSWGDHDVLPVRMPT